MTRSQCPFHHRWLHIWKFQLQKSVDPGRWMDELWLVEILITRPHPSRNACLFRPLILGCFRGHMSLLVHHSLICHAISPTHPYTHSQCLTSPKRKICCDGSGLVMREEPIGCFHLFKRCSDNRLSGNRSVKVFCSTCGVSSHQAVNLLQTPERFF